MLLFLLQLLSLMLLLVLAVRSGDVGVAIDHDDDDDADDDSVIIVVVSAVVASKLTIKLTSTCYLKKMYNIQGWSF